MGYDLFSKKKNAENEAEYFRSSIWSILHLRRAMRLANVNARTIEKFTDNSGRHVTAKECREVADRLLDFLKSCSSDLTLGVVEESGFEAQFKAIFFGATRIEGAAIDKITPDRETTGDEPLDFDHVGEFAIYNDRCSRLGGYEVR